MTPGEQLEEEVKIGVRVKKFLEEPEIIAAFKEVRAQAQSEFAASEGNTDKLRQAWSLTQGVERVERQLRALIGRGEIAAGKLEALSRSRVVKRLP